ncbi:DUF6377 domain-containing protein [Carboxylicivirga caseinilyticus]|uniref:DUF6377 domain-containing protein n=1 Tax=Carboxylicivirga caseinilyticus TaxID=3417572 RepID=UPI003D34A28B|nr:hypothetical protein [Marinilabiliaceae bacterium A049]
MKYILLVILMSFSTLDIFSNSSKDTILYKLLELIESKDSYQIEKDKRVADLKQMLNVPNVTPRQYYEIHYKLYNEYKTYISDSAIYYTKQNLEIAKELQDSIWISESKLDLVSHYVVAGMYIDALEILNSIQNKYLPDWLQVKYYECYKQFYDYYSRNNPYTLIYLEKSQQYRDSLLNILDEQSNHYKIVYAEKLYDEFRLDESKQILQQLIDQTKSDTHEKAVLSYALANIYMKEGNVQLQKHNYAISAICDIKNVIKENASMQALAYVLYNAGEVESAYYCIKSSMEDAMFCNARLRTYEVSQILPIIDSAFQETIIKKKSELLYFLIFVSILSFFLIIAIVYVYRQMKRVTSIRKELYQTNVKLNGLNEDLQSSNNQLNDVNKQLVEANQIKEAYIGHFLDLCSTYIDKLEKYQNTLNKKAAEKKLDELYKMLKSRDMINNEIKELYENFDNIFLHLYPNFVEEFNSLLLKDQKFILKPNELLNVELRMFALIRLGISDSSKIANFLHYSANTIYSYRTRVRNKAAVPREKFESMVMKIGAFKKS